MKLKYEIITTEIDDQLVAVPVGDNAEQVNSVIHLNETAAEIVGLLSNEITEEQIVNELAIKYDETSKEEIREYVKKFTEELKEAELLV